MTVAAPRIERFSDPADEPDSVGQHLVQTSAAAIDEDLAFLRLTARPNYDEGSKELSIVDLFCGCGGMTLGFAHAAHRAGFGVRIPLAIDLDPHAIAVFKKNFPSANALTGNVCDWFGGRLERRLSGEEQALRKAISGGVDALMGGPPCQGNSDLNNHSRRHDPRNALYKRMARAARVLQARSVIIENVPAVQHDHNGVVERTIHALEREGYRTAQGVLNLARLGVPQRRRRHLLIATLDGLAPEGLLRDLELIDLGKGRTVRWAIEDLLKVGTGQNFDKPSTHNSENAKRIAWLFDHGKFDLPNRLRPACHKDKDHSYNSVYGRLQWNRPAQTITTGFGSMGQGRYVHPSQRRTITPHEAARLQCLPDFFSFEAVDKRGAWADLIGNAVPPLLMSRIAEKLFAYLENASSPSLPAR